MTVATTARHWSARILQNWIHSSEMLQTRRFTLNKQYLTSRLPADAVCKQGDPPEWREQRTNTLSFPEGNQSSGDIVGHCGGGRGRGTKQICPVTKPTFDTSFSHLFSISLPCTSHNCDNTRVGLAATSVMVILRGQKFMSVKRESGINLRCSEETV
jgi:hypothetical protein